MVSEELGESLSILQTHENDGVYGMTSHPLTHPYIISEEVK